MLTERYQVSSPFPLDVYPPQISENIRSNRQLAPIFLLHVLYNLSILVYNFVMVYSTSDDDMIMVIAAGFALFNSLLMLSMQISIVA